MSVGGGAKFHFKTSNLPNDCFSSSSASLSNPIQNQLKVPTECPVGVSSDQNDTTPPSAAALESSSQGKTSHGDKALGPSSLLLAVSEHLLPLQDHLVELLQAGLQALAVHGRAALSVVECGRAQLVQRQHLLHLCCNTEG